MKRILAMALLVCLVLSGCSTQVQETCFSMDTVMTLDLWGADSREAAAQLKALLKDLEKTWSATDEASLLSRLNRGDETPLTPEQQALLQQAEEMQAYTDGCFDPRLGAFVRAWGFYDKNYRIPTGAELESAGAQWDLGGILKGYAADACVALLERHQIDRALLNLGGNIQTYGQKADGTPWKIGIQNPDGGDYIGIVSVTGTAAIVTSGDYQRYFQQDGIRYHHILDPRTGRPADSDLRSVTVICQSGTTADALSTALFVMGLEQAAAFWREHRDFEAVFLAANGQAYATEGVVLSGCEYEVIGYEN